MQNSIPAFEFEFLGGISNRGIVERVCSSIESGRKHRFRYYLDDLPLAAAFGTTLPQYLADFVDIAVAVYVADRLAPRAVPGDQRPMDGRWHRRLHVAVPLRVPGFWSQEDVLVLLEKLLDFLADDDFSFQFVSRTHSPRPAECQASLLPEHGESVSVVLSSDGLDSLCGVSLLLSRAETSAVVPVTVATNRRVAASVRDIVSETRDGLSSIDPKLVPVQLRARISSLGRPRRDRESTQRTRGLLFLAAGIATAVVAGTDRLFVCENGIGAISLPMSPDHWGSRATKAMHPSTLTAVSNLASIARDRPFAVENLGLFSSKGQLVEELPANFRAAAMLTASCDQTVFSRWRNPCGKCTSCLLRRVAVSAAGLNNDIDGPIRYSTDWFDPTASWLVPDQLPLMAMRYQAETLRRGLERDEGFDGLVREFYTLREVVALAPTLGVSREELEQKLYQLYCTYVKEFDVFVDRIDRPGLGRRATIVNLAAPLVPSMTG